MKKPFNVPYVVYQDELYGTQAYYLFHEALYAAPLEGDSPLWECDENCEVTWLSPDVALRLRIALQIVLAK